MPILFYFGVRSLLVSRVLGDAEVFASPDVMDGNGLGGTVTKLREVEVVSLFLGDIEDELHRGARRRAVVGVAR